MDSRPVALITGGTRGIGLGIARSLAAAGTTPLVNGVREAAEVEEVVEELRRLDPAAHYYRADVGDADQRQSMLDAVRADHGRLDLLVNNAGIPTACRGDLLDATEESFERVLRTNLQGPYFLSQAVARWMLEQRRAHPERPMSMINVTSISAIVASPTRGDYCISKAGMSMATQVFAARLAQERISVYELRPGFVRTGMTEKVADDYDPRIRESDMLLEKRWGTPEDMGRAVVALARGDLPYATGQILTLDGGLTLRRL